MSAHDPLADYRGENSDADLSAGERLLKQQMHLHAGPIRLYQASEAMQRWLDGTLEGQALQDEVQQTINDAVAVWLKASDPGSEECRKAHFEARVAVGIIQRVDSIIQRGAEAGRAVREADSLANAELSHV